MSGSTFTPSFTQRLARWQMQPMLKIFGFTVLSLERTESFDPTMVLQLSLANPTTLAHGMLLSLKKYILNYVNMHSRCA